MSKNCIALSRQNLLFTAIVSEEYATDSNLNTLFCTARKFRHLTHRVFKFESVAYSSEAIAGNRRLFLECTMQYLLSNTKYHKTLK